MTAAWESISVKEAAQLAVKAAQQFDSGELELLRSGILDSQDRGAAMGRRARRRAVPVGQLCSKLTRS